MANKKQNMLYILLLNFLFLSINNAKVIILQPEPVRVIEGSMLELVCTYNGTGFPGGNLTFSKFKENGGTEEIQTGMNGFEIHKAAALPNTPLKTILKKEKVEISDGGKYKCQHTKDTTEQNSMQSTVQVIEVLGGNETLKDKVASVVLSCKPDFHSGTSTLDNNYQMIWAKNNSVLDNAAKYTMNNTHLEIKNPARNVDTGVYNCIFVFKGAGNTENRVKGSVSLLSAPYIDKKHAVKSMNLVKGEDLHLDCPVTGFPKPNTVWYKNGDQIDPTVENDRYSFQDTSGAEKGRLIVYSLEFEDKGKYKCEAFSPMFNSTELEVLIRVKDKLEALWPFLGILAEIIVLVIIILIAEKRKRSQEEALDSADGATEPIANATYHGGDDVRHRNVRA